MSWSRRCAVLTQVCSTDSAGVQYWLRCPVQMVCSTDSARAVPRTQLRSRPPRASRRRARTSTRKFLEAQTLPERKNLCILFFNKPRVSRNLAHRCTSRTCSRLLSRAPLSSSLRSASSERHSQRGNDVDVIHVSDDNGCEVCVSGATCGRCSTAAVRVHY